MPSLLQPREQAQWNFLTGLLTGGIGAPGDIGQAAQDTGIGLLNARMQSLDPTGRMRAMSGMHAPLQGPQVPYGSAPLQARLGGDPSAPESLLGFVGSPEITDVWKLMASAPLALGLKPTTTAGRIRNKTLNEGGYTANIATGEVPKEGLLVGKFKNTDPRNKVLKGNITKSDIEDFVKTNEKSLARVDQYLGTWRDPESGLTYMDVSQRFDPSEIRKATKFGERTGQIAGFNIGTFEGFPVGNWREFIRSPEFAARMSEMEKVGQNYLKTHPTDEWWDIHGTLFEEVYGPGNLEALAGFIASTAPNTSPTQNLRIASEYMRRQLIGEDIIQPNWRVPAGTQTRTEGVRLSMHENHPGNLLAASEGRLTDLRADKVREEAQALMGDPDAAVFDRWWARISEKPEAGVFTATQEGAFEANKKTYSQYQDLKRVVTDAASSEGRSVRDFSADVWTGIRETVKDTNQLFGQPFKGSALAGESKGYADLFDDLIKSKAKFVGISVEKFKERLARGDAELLTLVLAAPLGSHAFSQLRGANAEIGRRPETGLLGGNVPARGQETL